MLHVLLSPTCPAPTLAKIVITLDRWCAGPDFTWPLPALGVYDLGTQCWNPGGPRLPLNGKEVPVYRDTMRWHGKEVSLRNGGFFFFFGREVTWQDISEESNTTPSDSLSPGKMRLVGKNHTHKKTFYQQYNSLKILKTSFLEILKKTIHNPLLGLKLQNSGPWMWDPDFREFLPSLYNESKKRPRKLLTRSWVWNLPFASSQPCDVEQIL